VREDGGRPRTQLGCERRGESHAAKRLCRRADLLDPDVRRQRCVSGRKRQNHELVDSRGERAQHRNGGAERGIVGVDALGDDDELHDSTSSRMRAA